MTDSTLKLAASIVQAYVSNNPVPVTELPKLIADTHVAFRRLLEPQEPEVEKPVPAVNPNKSVHRDYIISLENGKRYRALKRHLGALGMTPEQYKEKWNLPPNYPVVAADYATKRSELAKAIGLGKHRGKGKKVANGGARTTKAAK